MPRKVFTAGEILTAANLNDVSDQSVMVFDDATARTTAIPTPVEGMTTYLKDLDAVEFFDGSVFRRVGGLIAVKSAIFTGTQAAGSVAGGANVAVTDLSITHEVANASNKLIISAFLGATNGPAGRGDVGIAVHDGTGLIAVGASVGSRTVVTAGGRTVFTSAAALIATPSVTFVHAPGAGSKTYTVRAINASTTTGTVVINRNNTDSDNANNTRAVSSIVIQEVAV